MLADEPAAPIGDGGLVRLRLDLGYEGTAFSGWAVQPGRRTVQGVLEAELATMLRTDRVPLVVAGRTDAGVHAAGQVAHLDVPSTAWASLAPTAVRRLAGMLPPDIRVFRIAEVTPAFSARFSALWRRYCYRLTDADFGTEPLRRRDTVAWRRRLDAAAMHASAQQLLGLNDFVAFCRRRAGASTVRDLQSVAVTRTGPLIEVRVQADAFCHSMVRSLVGALVAVGDGRRPLDWPAQLLSHAARSDEVVVAPARGLTLVEVAYPPDGEWAARAALTRTTRSRLDVRR